MVKNAVSGLGLSADAAMITFPIDPFLVGSDLTPIKDRASEFSHSLTAWTGGATQTGIGQNEAIRIPANSYEDAFERLNQKFLVDRLGDGLPIIPATAERVDGILRGTDRARLSEVGRIMPRGGIATVETIAVALAMAGGRPEYMPVLIAAVEALLDPGVEHDKIQATSGSTFPVVIVNGSVSEEIRLNSGFGLVGPDPKHPAGASIGRALRLLMQNVGGAEPGIGTMAMFGGMRYTNAVFAEDEAGLPPGWPPLLEQLNDWPRGTPGVTLHIATGASNIMRRGVGKETPDDEARQSLERVAGYLRSPSPHYTHGWADGTPGTLVISRVVAAQLAANGWDPTSIREFLWERSKFDRRTLEETGMVQWIEQAPDARTRASVNETVWPITRTPEQILLCVAGGHHPTHNFWMQAYAPRFATRAISLPSGWGTLIEEADNALGPRGEHCVI
ncbi:MAG: hypothetical protein AAF493_11095 [Pseudomonadota bacterium]